MRNRIIRFKKSLHYARNGIWHAMLTQPNMWIHLFAALTACIFAWIFEFTAIEWAILIMVICVVLILEMVNTVAEIVVDLASPDFSDLARIAKDVSAGAVLIAALGSILTGICLFGPRIWSLISG